MSNSAQAIIVAHHVPPVLAGSAGTSEIELVGRESDQNDEIISTSLWTVSTPEQKETRATSSAISRKNAFDLAGFGARLSDLHFHSDVHAALWETTQ